MARNATGSHNQGAFLFQGFSSLVDRLLAGEVAPAIKVDGDMIVATITATLRRESLDSRWQEVW